MISSMMPKRALADITNRVSKFNDSYPSKRSATSQKVSSKSSIPKRTRPLPVEKVPLAHKRSPIDAASNYIDIDAQDKLNNAEGSDFAAVIHKNHLLAETKHLPNSTLLQHHRTVTKDMRSILVDWLADVCVSLKLKDSSFHLCVHILDRFLQTHEPTRKTLQLVGSVCLYIATKYEEIYAPDASDFVTLSDGAFSRDDVVLMEACILNALRFEVSTPYCLTFLARIGKTLAAKGVPAHLVDNVLKSAQLFAELAMVDGCHLKYRPSHLSAAAALLSMQKLGVMTSWCESLCFHSGWSEHQLVRCVEDIEKLVVNARRPANRLSAVCRKFESNTINF